MELRLIQFTTNKHNHKLNYFDNGDVFILGNFNAKKGL
jgi:hypothetical protein